MAKIVIIGNGITGITAARNIRKLSDHEITVISAESKYFYSRPALMYLYMGHMNFEHVKPYEDWFWENNRINLVYDYVQKINTGEKKLDLAENESISYDKLIIATGSHPNKFGWPGENLHAVQGFYSLQDLENLEYYTQKGIHRGIVVGGGLIGVEMAEMLQSRGIPVTILVREQNYWDNVLPTEEARMVGEHIRDEHHIDVRLSTELQEILPDSEGRARAVITKDGEEVSADFVVLTPGVHPNLDIVKDTDIETRKGILIDRHFQTNIPDVYAAGDCAEFREPDGPPVEQLWYTGKMQGASLAKNICGHTEAYDRGIWFNSAKFMDIEYQTYGFVPNQLKEGEQTIYWQHPKENKAIRINYDANDGRVLGFNLLGIRYRHLVCEKWIKEQWHIEDVIQDLGAANFDPEFFKQFEKEVVRVYNEQNPGRELKLKRKKGLFAGIFK